MKKTVITFLAIAVAVSSFAQNIITEWRGPNRSGIYNETGLLTSWPEKGPNMLWSIDSLPQGYSSVAIAHNTIYVTGIDDKHDVLLALDMSGKIKWRVNYGRAWNKTFVDTRSTPTIEDNRIYLSSGLGDVACVDAHTGEIIWSKKSSEDFNGPYGEWGISESLLVVGDKVMYTPCGEQTTMVAYNKLNGELEWKTETFKDRPSYTSPLLVERGELKLAIQVSELYIFAVNTANGDIVWKFDFGKMAGGEWMANIHTNTPLYKDGEIFITSGYDHKSVMLSLSEDGKSVKQKWVTDDLDVHHGGAVLVDGHLYGTNWINNANGNWVCLDWATGELKYSTKWKTKGSIVSADGMLYCYDEKRGYLALVKASPEAFNVISSFRIRKGKGPHWSHIVIEDKVMYVRHGKALMAFDIKK